MDQAAAHEAMLKIRSEIKAYAKPGVTAGSIYELCIQLATEAGYGDYCIGAEANRIKFIIHGGGLELDEHPFLAKDQKTRTCFFEDRVWQPDSCVSISTSIQDVVQHYIHEKVVVGPSSSKP